MLFFKIKLSLIAALAWQVTAMDLSEIEKDGGVVRSDGSTVGITIIGSIANKTEPDQNVALIKERGKIRAIKKNMVLLENFRVIHVQEKFIYITNQTEKHLIYQDKFANEFEKKPGSNRQNDFLFAEDGFERSKSAIKMTAAYRDKLVEQDLSKIMMQATAIPHYQGQEIIGFKLLQIDPGSIYEKSGFVDHDIITTINGTKLNTATGAIKLLNSLKGANQINVEFIRHGQIQTMDISIN